MLGSQFVRAPVNTWFLFMPELRHDPIQRRWVIIAPERRRNPNDFSMGVSPPRGESCPFCEGNELQTPHEITAIRRSGRANEPGWEVRVIPNKYPVLRIEGDLDRKGIGVYDRMNGIGAHEIIIETPQHSLHLADAPLDRIESVLRIYRERLTDLLRDHRFKYVQIFKNHGAAAGALLPHAHSQIVATPAIPPVLLEEMESARDYYRGKERCLFCDLIQQELESGERIVTAGVQFVALAPYASRFPFEIFIAPRRHRHSFAESDDDLLRHLAVTVKDVLLRVKKCLGDPSFNFLIHTSPNIKAMPGRFHEWEALELDFHWHIELTPRLMQMSGFEWGTGFYINAIAPEEAAKYLRETEL
jgi:UDPglucose--hexose-1-phosphate uridylyltransferase